MFEDSNLFVGLDDVDDNKRIEAVDQLRKSVRQSEGELPVHNLTQLFQMLSDRVVDNNIDVARKSSELLCDLLNRDLQTTDIYFPIVLPALTFRSSICCPQDFKINNIAMINLIYFC